MNRSPEKNLEDPVEKTLSGLRDVSIPEGLDRRILRALEDHATVQMRPRRFTDLAWGTAAACSVAGIVAAALFFSSGRTVPDSSAKHKTSNTAPLRPVEKSKNSGITDPPAAPDLASTDHSDRIRHSRLHHGSNAIPTRTEVAESGNRPVNMPPPPLPLTRQERLLLEIAHRRPPFELAMLTSDRREAQEQRESSEFDQFFAPSEAELETERLNNFQPSEEGKP